MGIKRHCKRFKLTRTRAPGKRGFITALRCTDYKKGPGRPACSKYKRGGGRSPGLINKQTCTR